ncbi:uncharacterized protein [Nicotiana sylvestris]|uniref:uncharacterized protein n=1 Tax=Nicotiana sylvestris TaxID=4096 RepID=UPI00388C633D
MKDLWDEYASLVPPSSCDCAKSRDSLVNFERQHIYQFLMGLNDNYGHARSQILMMKPMPNINQVYAMLIQDEIQKQHAGGTYVLIDIVDPIALLVARNGGQKKNLYCDHCNMKGHTRTSCFKLMFCENCHMKGHLKEKCYKIRGYLADFKGKNKENLVTTCLTPLEGGNNVLRGLNVQQGLNLTAAPIITQDQYNQILSMLGKSSISEATANMAGATNHMIYDASLLNNDGLVGNSGKDLFTGKVKGISIEEDGLYVLKSQRKP